MPSARSSSRTGFSEHTSLPRGCAGFSVVPTMSISPFHRRSPDHALGVSLLETSGTGALALLFAIFASNLPEALGGAVGMRQQGRSRGFAIGVWSATAVVLAATVVL